MTSFLIKVDFQIFHHSDFENIFNTNSFGYFRIYVVPLIRQKKGIDKS